MPSKEDITVATSHGRGIVPAAAKVYEHAFRSDPVMAYYFPDYTLARRKAAFHDFFTRLLTAAALNFAIIYSASTASSNSSDCSSFAFLMLPGKTVDNPLTLIPAGIIGALWTMGFRGCYRMLREYVPMAEAAKLKCLEGTKQYYYLFILGTHPDFEGQGLGSALVRAIQEKVQQEDELLPLWLEATTEKSMRLYSRAGFEVGGEMHLGKGWADADGMSKEGGEGVMVWGMVWWPRKMGLDS